ncbi:MAG: zinc ribbon domain-containing protein [candidate division Zixibacteria bacterium]|nr:zinc ribbon domain-containing protein [candidate division Zixibacteria bacterium]
MPTYEYKCDACGNKFEEFQKMTDDPLTDCPICNTKGKARRLISAGAGLLFKGSGFYITDHRSSDYKKAVDAEKSSSLSSSSKTTSTKKTETISKPAAKAS